MKKIIISILLVISMCFPLTGCFNNPTEGCDGKEYPDFLDYYIHNDWGAFAKVEVSKLREGYYTEFDRGEEGGPRLLIAECTVVKDYYGKLFSGTAVNVVIPIETKRNTDVETIEAEIRSIFTESDHLLIGLDNYNSCFNYVHNGEQSVLDEESGGAYFVEFYDYKIIPINDGALDVTRIDDAIESLGATPSDQEKLWYPRYREEFDYFFPDGATDAELEVKLGELFYAMNK